MSAISYDQLKELLNDTANEICAAAELPAQGTRDAINLLVNAVLHRVEDPGASLAEIVDANYSENLEKVLKWIKS